MTSATRWAAMAATPATAPARRLCSPRSACCRSRCPGIGTAPSSRAPSASGNGAWTGVDQIILSISARGLTTGETPRIFADVYGATVSKDPISKITVKVLEELTEWRDRPLDKVYPVMFIDAIMVKIRDGLPDSVTTTWPLATVQVCVIHLLR